MLKETLQSEFHQSTMLTPTFHFYSPRCHLTNAFKSLKLFYNIHLNLAKLQYLQWINHTKSYWTIFLNYTRSITFAPRILNSESMIFHMRLKFSIEMKIDQNTLECLISTAIMSLVQRELSWLFTVDSGNRGWSPKFETGINIIIKSALYSIF